MGNLPQKMNGNYLPTWQMPMYSKLLHNDIDMLANENQTEKHIDEFDDDLGFRFGADPEEETDAPLRQNLPEDENEYKLVQLEWNGILKKYVVVVTNFLPMTLKTEGKAPVYDRLDFEEDLEFAEPDTKSICVSLPVRSSSENSYPVRRNGETDDDESSDGSSSSEDSEDSDNNASWDIIPSTNSCDSSNSEYRLKTVPVISNDDARTFLLIGPSDCLNSCNLTEQGARELQADNPELFATTEVAIAAFQTLKQNDFNETTHTLEYQAVANLILKYQDVPTAELMRSFPEQFQTIEDTREAIYDFKRKINTENQNPSESEKALAAFVSDQRQNSVLQQIFSGTTSDNLEEIFTDLMDSRSFFQYVARALFIHLEPEEDDSKLLIICNRDAGGMGRLTLNGATELQEKYPELFPTADFALSVFDELFAAEAPDTMDVDTLQYQAIAELAKKHISRGRIGYFIFDEEKHRGELYIEEIPYEMFSSRCLGFGIYDGSFFISKASRDKYKNYCFSTKNMLHFKKFVNNPETDSDYKIETIKLLFPPDDKDVTQEAFHKNIDLLIGNSYKRTQASFNEHSNKRGKKDNPR
ncbi:hypothetical protein [Endozoicomonas euniceicola]|uniref:Uncharacterized protein n=1 Tax=Endozoicomonas euniceicola TaxID=1234143 RepID=A0ABY6GXQ9_9GAMM|nr:hypothetical protein [Endozoicomonas euniceicola]UYM17460.1 hypothetical protein NX720_05940 [Endozoicomonas euniceicola]